MKEDKYGQSIKGDVTVTGNVNAATLSGDGTTMFFSNIYLQEVSADPDDPPEGMAVIWMTDGTGAAGDDGDVFLKITAGGSTKTATLADFSAL